MECFIKDLKCHSVVTESYKKAAYFASVVGPQYYQEILSRLDEAPLKTRTVQSINSFIQSSGLHLTGREDDYDDNESQDTSVKENWRQAFSLLDALKKEETDNIFKRYESTVNGLVDMLHEVPRQSKIIEEKWDSAFKLKAYFAVYCPSFKGIWEKDICPIVKKRTLDKAEQFRESNPINKDLLFTVVETICKE
jgi:hypothetical protein